MDTAARAAWLAAHTFLCPHLRARLTPAQCAANRARPDVTDASAGAWESMYAKEKPLRPSACGACQDWEALAGAVGTAEAAPALYMPENLLPGLPRRELPAPALPASQGGQAGQIPPASRRGGFQPRGQNLAGAQATYGEALPDWIAALAGACDASNQREVAAALGVSQQTVARCFRVRLKQSYHIERLARQHFPVEAAETGPAGPARLANAFRRVAEAQALAGRLAKALAEAHQLLSALQPQQMPQHMEAEHVHARESGHS